MSFRETLGRHLRAIETRDLDTLAATVADPLIRIMADGKLKREKREFVDAHRGWFAMQNWTLAAKPVEIYENAGLGVAVLHLDTARTGNGAKAISRSSSRTAAASG